MTTNNNSTIEFIHFDSLNQKYCSSNAFNTFPFDITNPTSCPNAFNCDFALPQPKYNIKKIYLRSIEIPLGFNNVRANSNLHYISIATTYIGGVYSNFYNVYLPDKTYKDINTLLADINTGYALAFPTINIVFSLNASGLVQVSSTSTAIFTNLIYVVSTNLSYLLGFRNNLNTSTTRLTVAAGVYILNIDNYISMYITNVSASSTNANQTLCHFKIPLNATNGIVYYNSESASFSQFINVNPSLVIQKLNICIYDRFGFSLHSNNLDYSYSLGLEQ